MSKVEMLGQAPMASDRLARPLSPATRAGDFIFVSGQVPTDEHGQVIVGGIEAQTRPVFLRLEQALAIYLRARYTDAPAWTKVGDAVRKARE